MTVGQPGPVTVPDGPGIGPTHASCVVGSPTLAAGSPPIVTVADPFSIMPGPPGTQAGIMQGCVWSVCRAAGCPPIVTVGQHGGMICNGIGGCGAGVGDGAAGCIGEWQCGPDCST